MDLATSRGPSALSAGERRQRGRAAAARGSGRQRGRAGGSAGLHARVQAVRATGRLHAVTVEPVDALGAALLGLAARGISHPGLGGWLGTPNPTFGGRRPAAVWAEQPDLVADIALLAAQHNFRRRPRP